MSESGGRRIKRALLIRVSSIHFVKRTSEAIKDKFSKRKKKAENYANQTLFTYISRYAKKSHPKINPDLTLMEAIGTYPPGIHLCFC